MDIDIDHGWVHLKGYDCYGALAQGDDVSISLSQSSGEDAGGDGSAVDKEHDPVRAASHR